MSCNRAMIAAALLAALAGCTTPNAEVGAGDPLLGESVRYNAALQTINPDPVYTDDMAKPGDNGEKGAAAVERYRKDQVNDRHQKEVSASRSGSLSTTEGTSSGSGPQ